MNPLEKLKQQLMVKPTVEERERVAVVIKGDKASTKRQPAIETQQPAIETQQQTIETQQHTIETQQPVEEKKNTQIDKKLPIIVDETNIGFDR
jgi:hypothetical protein